jgi:hypothetical protein
LDRFSHIVKTHIHFFFKALIETRKVPASDVAACRKINRVGAAVDIKRFVAGGVAL